MGVFLYIYVLSIARPLHAACGVRCNRFHAASWRVEGTFVGEIMRVNRPGHCLDDEVLLTGNATWTGFRHCRDRRPGAAVIIEPATAPVDCVFLVTDNPSAVLVGMTQCYHLHEVATWAALQPRIAYPLRFVRLRRSIRKSSGARMTAQITTVRDGGGPNCPQPAPVWVTAQISVGSTHGV